MSTQTVTPETTTSANLVHIGSSVEDAIQQRLAEERARLEREAGLGPREARQGQHSNKAKAFGNSQYDPGVRPKRAGNFPPSTS